MIISLQEEPGQTDLRRYVYDIHICYNNASELADEKQTDFSDISFKFLNKY